MKKISKLNLKNATIISNNEMKHIIGGYEYAGNDDELAKKNACIGKNLCDSCSWEGLTTHFGQCSQSPLVDHLFCSSLRCFY